MYSMNLFQTGRLVIAASFSCLVICKCWAGEDCFRDGRDTQGVVSQLVAFVRSVPRENNLPVETRLEHGNNVFNSLSEREKRCVLSRVVSDTLAMSVSGTNYQEQVMSFRRVSDSFDAALSLAWTATRDELFVFDLLEYANTSMKARTRDYQEERTSLMRELKKEQLKFYDVMAKLCKARREDLTDEERRFLEAYDTRCSRMSMRSACLKGLALECQNWIEYGHVRFVACKMLSELVKDAQAERLKAAKERVLALTGWNPDGDVSWVDMPAKGYGRRRGWLWNAPRVPKFPPTGLINSILP